MTDAALDPQGISRFRKERFLLSLSEDDFRDRVIRPLFFRLGYQDGRDVCGPTEQGKDALFSERDKLGLTAITAVQTKKGSVNLSRKAEGNITNAITQLRTALQTSIPFIASKTSCYPSKLYLCASGKINLAAKNHIVDEVKDPRIQFLDADDLIPLIDSKLPELWFDIDTESTPYFRAIKRIVEGGQADDKRGALRSELVVSGATDDIFVPLKLFRASTRYKKVRGQAIPEPHIEEFPATGIIDKPYKRVIMAGEAGSGKSTTLLRIAYVLADRALKNPKQHHIPVLIRAIDLIADKQTALLGHAAMAARRLIGSSTPVFSLGDLREGRVTILIDALDEVSHAADRAHVVSLINAFHAEYPRCQVIMTTRITRDLANLPGYQVFSVTPISFRQAEKLVRKIQKGKPGAMTQSRELLRRMEQVHGIELNPLLVTVFAATAEYSRQDIPANITELFKKFTELMLGRWDETKGLAHQYQAPLKDFLLTHIAFYMHEQKVTGITRDTFERLLAHELDVRGYTANTQQIVHEILERSGLFRLVGDNVEFRHHLLQEFFAGRGIPSIEFIKQVVKDQWWKTAIVFYFGENPGQIAKLKEVMQSASVGSAAEIFDAVTAIGLALQACYLSEVTEKLEVWKWVAGSLAATSHSVLSSDPEHAKYPLSTFVYYYLFGRDSVALHNLKDHHGTIDRWIDDDMSLQTEEERSSRRLWLISALIEIGELDAAKKLLAEFKPHDPRQWLAVYLGCRINAELRLPDTSDRNKAIRMCAELEPKVQALKSEVIKEFGSHLLELRQGKIKAVDGEDVEDRK
jgi:hypothetical protein